MVKFGTIVLLWIASIFAQAWVTTEIKIDIDTMFTQKYGKPIEAYGSVPFMFFVKTNDVNDSGYANDSVVLYSGYRSFWLTNDKYGVKDTVFSVVKWLDTLTIQNMDTASINGYALDISSPFGITDFGTYIQPVIKPAMGTRVKKSIGWVMIDIQRATGAYIVERK